MNWGQVDTRDFESYILFPASYYINSISQQNSNHNFRNLNNECAKYAISTLKDILSFASYKKISDSEIELQNRYYYIAFRGISQLLYYIIRNKDIENLEIFFEEFRPLFNEFAENRHTYRYNLSILELSNANGQNSNQINSLKKKYETDNKQFIYYKHALTGAKYWVYFLFSEEAIDEKSADEFIGKINIGNYSSEEILKDLIFFQNNAFHYFYWDEWDFMERPNGVIYHPPVPYNWLTFGFVANSIRENNFFLRIDYLDFEDINNAQYLSNKVIEYKEYFKNNFKYWSKILKVGSLMELSERLDKIISQLIQLKREVINAEEKIIANASLNQNKVNDFKQRVIDKWRERANIHKLFTDLSAVSFTNDETAIEGGIKQNSFIQNAKGVFTDNTESIANLGLADVGHAIAKREEESFFYLLSRKKVDYKNNDIISLLEGGVILLKDRSFSPSLIFVPYQYRFQESLLNNLKFKSKKQEAGWTHTNQVFGYYDNLPLYAMPSEFLSSKIIIADFSKAFSLVIHSNESLPDNILSINVRKLSDTEATDRLHNEVERWTYTEDGVTLSDDDAIIKIKNSVLIELKLPVSFQLLDENAFVIGLIEHE
jgi:hypothetical protein